MSTNPVIEAESLTKRYGKSTVVDDISLTVMEGEVIGLLGPNGAGKTTTILMLLGLTEASEGSVRILGHDPFRDPLEVKRQVGYMPDSVGFYDNLSGKENLRYTAKLGGLSARDAEERIGAALVRVHLDQVGDRRVATYSRGMRQRLGLAELLMRDSRIAILDEPTSGLDPQSTAELLELIRGFARDGMTVIVSSHLLDIVQSICSRVALFNKGRIGFMGTVEELAREVADGGFHIDLGADHIDVVKLQKDVDGIASIIPLDGTHWQINATRDLRPDLASAVVRQGGALLRLDAHHIGLEEAYSRYFSEVAK